MDFLKVPSTAPECGNDRGRHLLLRRRCRQPLARSYVHQIHCGGRFAGVIEVRPADAAQPEPPVGVAAPHKRAVIEVGESADPTDKPFLFARAIHVLPEAAQAEPSSAADGSLRLDGIVAGTHRRAVDGDHDKHRALITAGNPQACADRQAPMLDALGPKWLHRGEPRCGGAYGAVSSSRRPCRCRRHPGRQRCPAPCRLERRSRAARSPGRPARSAGSAGRLLHALS